MPSKRKGQSSKPRELGTTSVVLAIGKAPRPLSFSPSSSRLEPVLVYLSKIHIKEVPVNSCISAIQHLRPLLGGAQAHLLRASDRACYVTKFQNNPQHIRVLANEMFAPTWVWRRAFRCHGWK